MLLRVVAFTHLRKSQLPIFKPGDLKDGFHAAIPEKWNDTINESRKRCNSDVPLKVPKSKALFRFPNSSS